VLYIRIKTVKLLPLEKEALEIKKKYSARLIEALNPGSYETEKTIKVRSMEDLIKVADELAKPVLYQAPDSSQPGYAYFVIDGTTRYQYLPGT
jgi:hypothetical protein